VLSSNVRKGLVICLDVMVFWVHNDFVRRLENEEGFKFCIHHRDFEVGETISGNVDHFLQNSWKVVVIISNAFTKPLIMGSMVYMILLLVCNSLVLFPLILLVVRRYMDPSSVLH
jgi:hypothetical protein